MAEAAPMPQHGAAKAERDLRLDFFRGLSLFFIFIDHVPGNLLAYATFHGLAFFDAAEVFIFISGFTAALVYGRSLMRNRSEERRVGKEGRVGWWPERRKKILRNNG